MFPSPFQKQLVDGQRCTWGRSAKKRGGRFFHVPPPGAERRENRKVSPSARPHQDSPDAESSEELGVSKRKFFPLKWSPPRASPSTVPIRVLPVSSCVVLDWCCVCALVCVPSCAGDCFRFRFLLRSARAGNFILIGLQGG